MPIGSVSFCLLGIFARVAITGERKINLLIYNHLASAAERAPSFFLIKKVEHMAAYDLYGFPFGKTHEARRILDDVIGIKFEPRNGDHLGGKYFQFKVRTWVPKK